MRQLTHAVTLLVNTKCHNRSTKCLSICMGRYFKSFNKNRV